MHLLLSLYGFSHPIDNPGEDRHVHIGGSGAKGQAQAVDAALRRHFQGAPDAAREPDLPGHGPNPPAGAANFGRLRRAKVSDTDINLEYRPAAALSWVGIGRPKT